MSKITPNFNRGEFLREADHSHYMEGFMEARDKHMELIDKLCDALCNRHADDYVDDFREKYGL